ncbi:immunoglobulin-binding protein 1b isoform X2 [Eurytemora carolleeae]|uniref:immunoglobulin-binding protein 1b isoform X2 n=1 Tax=Eurytemora carolleeae TaxID=1294199 RepID=UPI000C78F1E4|nr:immunoglobulin-binding protein 1b isoform X2 [Eurytemora carolleeae]|eukprot:XP_023325696.1 immunoglobulin-binding protein 1b-like isoform X2 [Eurytemora affinis]
MTAPDKNEESLSEMFDRGLGLQEEIENSPEPSNSPEYQNKVKKGILILEDATRFVSSLDLFSRNENYKELETSHLKYFLLPVLLADLNSRLTEGERENIVEICQIYYIDFLTRTNDYGFGDVRIPVLKTMKKEGDQEGSEDHQTKPGSRIPDLNKMNSEREEKMARFREKKEVELEIKRLKELVIDPASRDDDLIRNLQINMIKRFRSIALEELDSLHMEIDILHHRRELRAGRVEAEPVKPARPLQPIIITKDNLQKEMYGLGYPSLPVLSVDEFYDHRSNI